MKNGLLHRFGSLSDVRTIEFGAGRGDISFLLAREGARVTVVDSSPVAIKQARYLFEHAGLQVNCVLEDVRDLSTSAKFDASMSFGLIEHFSGDSRSRIIAKHTVGECTFISVPNAYSFPYRVWKYWLEKTASWRYGIESPFTRRELSDQLAPYFDVLQIMVVPLFFTLKRKFRFPFSFRTPLDSLFGYSFVAFGETK